MDDLIYAFVNAQKDANATKLALKRAISEKLNITISDVEVYLEYNNYFEELLVITIDGGNKLSEKELNQLNYDYYDGYGFVIKIGDAIP